MQQVNFIDVFFARHVSGTYASHQERQMLSCSIWYSAPVHMLPCTAPPTPHTRPTQRLSRPPPIQKLGAENRMLHLNI